MTESYYRYWGKAEKDGQGYHLLSYHCLDVAAVAARWWRASPSIRRAWSAENRMPDDQLLAWVLFFVALHDYGKFDVRFQLRVKPLWERLYDHAAVFSNLPSVHDCKTYYHGERGLAWFIADHGQRFGAAAQDVGLHFLDDPDDAPNGQWTVWRSWMETVTGHHGTVIPAEYSTTASLPPTCDPKLGYMDNQARSAWTTALEELFLKPADLSLADNPPFCSPLLAGFCSVSDWLGSRSDENLFRYQTERIKLRDYLEMRSEDATRVLELAGVIGRSRAYLGVQALLEPDKKPRSLQTLVDKLPLRPGLSIVEAPTGSGKTEAALSYAWRLIEAELADSIIFALPTQATANAMLGRLKRIAPIIFADNLNLLLAHGSARFNKEFVEIKHKALEGYEGEDGWVQCSEWLAESRKRVFLGQVGVCTVDQVLISVLPVRHRFVRGFGIGRGILIVDEVHAYDAYMYGLLEEVLREQQRAGGSAILLSATLPELQRRKLGEAWGAELNVENKAAYPLISWTNGQEGKPFMLDSESRPQDTSVKIETIRVSKIEPDEALLKQIVGAAEQGAQVAVICNLVDVAQGIARDLRTLTKLPVDLFHARYCYVHRREKELDAIERFGASGDRSKGRILVATQVIEQSLDLDFDWIITQLCPVDLLFQRMGRLHRHDRPVRPEGFENPLCTVLLPPDDKYGLHELIYANRRALWRTGQKLTAHGVIVFPEAYRNWIETVYQEEPWEDEPEEITAAYQTYKDTVLDIKGFLSRQMIERARGMNPFNDTDEAITAVTRDGDMNRMVIPFCKTAEGSVLMDGTILEKLGELERLEALSLNSVGVPESWKHYLADPDEERRCWLEMNQEGEYFVAKSRGVVFRYHKDIGLEKRK